LNLELHPRPYQRQLQIGSPRPLLFKGSFPAREEGAGLGERLFGSGPVALEFLIQCLERLRFGFQGIPFCRQHPRSRVIGSITEAGLGLIRARQTPELRHQRDGLGRERSQRRLGRRQPAP
jgi:hypothetical protein